MMPDTHVSRTAARLIVAVFPVQAQALKHVQKSGGFEEEDYSYFNICKNTLNDYIFNQNYHIFYTYLDN